MTQELKIGNLKCSCASGGGNDRIAYIIYPTDSLRGIIESTAAKYQINIAVITGLEWQDSLSPWPAKGIQAGTPDFKGQAYEFLRFLQQEVIPRTEKALGLGPDVERTLVGVSMSGLFALWQWIECNTFTNIGSLSGSFWYDGFAEWVKNSNIPPKAGHAFFLLGNQESNSGVKGFDSVEIDTQEIVDTLTARGIDVGFTLVPGNHFANPLPRLNTALSALFLKK